MDHTVFSISVFLFQNYDPSCHTNCLVHPLSLSSSVLLASRRGVLLHLFPWIMLHFCNTEISFYYSFPLCLWQMTFTDRGTLSPDPLLSSRLFQSAMPDQLELAWTMKSAKSKLIWGLRESGHAWSAHEAGQLGFYLHGGVRSLLERSYPKSKRGQYTTVWVQNKVLLLKEKSSFESRMAFASQTSLCHSPMVES